VIWEFTDADLGHVMGRGFVARMTDGHWYAVFGNGYNSTAGKAALFLVPLDRSQTSLTAVKIEVDTAGSNGLSEPALIDKNGDKIIDTVYAGDLKGNVWKFDLSGSKSTWDNNNRRLKLFQAISANNTPQPITSPLEIGPPPAGASGYMIYFGTGKYLGNSDIGNLATQTVYGLLDNGSAITSRSSLQSQTFVYEGDRTESDPSDVRVASTQTVDYSGGKGGWYLDLLPPGASTGVGERVVSVPLLRHGRLIVTSIVPSADACKQGGYSWITEIEALTGGRLSYNVFDYNGDNLFNNDDDRISGDERDRVTSKKLEEEGLMKSPTVISAGEVEYKVGSGTSGGVVVIKEKGMGGNPRSSWRQLLPN